ncbi:MFS transporter [Pseudomonas sp. CCC3.1]|uniref:MFS transporter n=1 Tax=Pseudomonas sp. CCC3.1 TaxID=3048607 RepID=UPI002AC941F0|nr:MFS transporter [Pseudomonas sp. CCC3.1]MEB0207005.1 MFS transporter [Pseudomonas sp. CCC3.1]WPX39092.1 MFS transporter [Pseudomonas sp. CCC3.1]
MIIGCALCMELIDSTVVMTALPQMASDFGAPSIRMNLVVSLYMLAAALCVPVSGWAADRFGPRRLFVLAIILFIVSSLACAASSSLLQLCLARMLQGAAGAMMVPVGQMILLRWSPREDLLRNLSYLTIPALIGPMIGPPLGGLMVTYLSWHWIFLINVPIGVVGIVLVLRHVPHYPGARERGLDRRGLVLSAIAMATLVFGFEALGHGLMPRPWVALMIGVGIVCGALYLRHSRRYAEPLLDLKLLRIPSYGISFWGGNLLRLGTSSLPFLLVLMFQLCFGLSPLHAGLLTLAGGAGAFLMKLLAVRVVRRFGIRRTLITNAVLTGLTLAACASFTSTTPYSVIVLMLFGSAVIRSLQYSTLGALTYADVPAELSSRASSLSAVTVQLSMSLSVGLVAALLGVLMNVRGHAVPQTSDVAWMLVLCGLACMASALVFRRLAVDAGNAVYAART